jgi:hypothetical protein
MDESDVVELLKNLMNASSSLYSLVKFKEGYGKKFYVFGSGGIVPYEQALSDAMDKLEKALVEAGQIHVCTEIQNRRRELLQRLEKN